MVFKTSLVVSMLLNMVLTAPIELCKVNKVWGEASYENKDTCDMINLKLKAHTFTMGGFSSGAYLTSNLFAMFNDAIDGVAINAGHGPCATAGFTCPYGVTTQYKMDGIKNKPVFVYSGTADHIVKTNLSMQTADYFESLGGNVTRSWIYDFVHAYPNNVQTNYQYNPPRSCGRYDPPFNGAVNCGYNIAFEVFKHLYGEEGLYKDVNYQDSGNLYAIDQRPFNTEGARLADQGFLYVPNACLNESCRFHLEFHGCTETIVTFNDTFVRQLGYMEHAAASKIIMLFPQVNHPDSDPFPHCWISGGVHDNKHPQIVAFQNMVKTVFDRDLFNLGALKTENVATMVKSLPISKQMMNQYMQKFMGQDQNSLII